LLRSGASLVDMMADYFDPSPDELSMDPGAIQRQKDLIGQIHACGGKVLMSSHACRFLPAGRVLEMALAQQDRGADYVKIVTGAQTVEEEVENLRITHLLRERWPSRFCFYRRAAASCTGGSGRCWAARCTCVSTSTMNCRPARSLFLRTSRPCGTISSFSD
jgi:hypothetical protein